MTVTVSQDSHVTVFYRGRLTTSANDLFRAIIGEEKERSHLQRCVLISQRRERGKNVVSHALYQVSLELSLARQDAYCVPGSAS